MTLEVAALLALALLSGLAFVVLPSLNYPGLATLSLVAMFVFAIGMRFMLRNKPELDADVTEVAQPQSSNPTGAAEEVVTTEGETTMVYYLWLRLIALVAGLSSVATGIAMWLVYVFGIQGFVVPYIDTYFSFIANGVFALMVYGVSNVADALTPQVSPSWNTFGRWTSRFALVAIGSATLFTLMQLGNDVDRIKQVFLQSGSLQLLLGVGLFALFDVTVLQALKNASLARHQTTSVPGATVVQHAPVAANGNMVQVIRSDDGSLTYNIYCNGQGVRILPPLNAGDPPQVEVLAA